MIPVYKCKKCRWIGKNTILVDGDTECCPRCYDVNFIELVSLEKKNTFTSDDLKVLWQLFQEDVPVKNNIIEDYFIGFSAGTECRKIWEWFDSIYPGGITALISEQRGELLWTTKMQKNL